MIGVTRLRRIRIIQRAEEEYYNSKYNQHVLRQCIESNPDIVVLNNESRINPNTISLIRNNCKSLMVSLLWDDPWDSIRWHHDFPHSLKYFDYIFSADPTWNNNIRKVAPKAKIFWHFGGYDPDRFYPEDTTLLSEEVKSMLSCDIAFTGSSYGSKAEGAYRSDILSYLCDYDLKIWGGDNWPGRNEKRSRGDLLCCSQSHKILYYSILMRYI